MKRKTYIIEAENGMVKIGASANPFARLANIRTISPFKVRLIAILSLSREKEMHDRFAEYRFHGEWFIVSGELANFLPKVWSLGLNAKIHDWSAIHDNCSVTSRGMRRTTETETNIAMDRIGFLNASRRTKKVYHRDC